MRLTDHTREVIRNTTCEVFGPEARVRLLGSRTDDTQRGGDIDLLVELPVHDPDSRKKSLTLAARLQMRLSDQPIDILVLDPQTRLQPIHRVAAATGIPGMTASQLTPQDRFLSTLGIVAKEARHLEWSRTRSKCSTAQSGFVLSKTSPLGSKQDNCGIGLFMNT